MNIQELEEMLQRAATNGREISREDFYNIMTKKAFWWIPIYLKHFNYYKSLVLNTYFYPLAHHTQSLPFHNLSSVVLYWSRFYGVSELSHWDQF